MKETANNEIPHVYSRKRVKLGIWLSLIGFSLLYLGAKPENLGLDRSPVIGFTQIGIILFGLGLMSLGAYISLKSFWPRGHTTISADFGMRFIMTGLVIAVFSGMADVFGIGSHPLTGLIYFGKLQAAGVIIGEGLIALGVVMLIMPPFSTLPRKTEDNTEKINMNE